MKFRKIPVEVDAIQFTGDNFQELDVFAVHLESDSITYCFNSVEPEYRGDDPDIIAEVWDKLHSTWVGVKKNDWIIRGIQGEFYPCDNEVFIKTYERVE